MLGSSPSNIVEIFQKAEISTILESSAALKKLPKSSLTVLKNLISVEISALGKSPTELKSVEISALKKSISALGKSPNSVEIIS